MKRTPRGFAVFGQIKDRKGNSIRVQMSSEVGGPFCWIFTVNADGAEYVKRDPVPVACDPIGVATPYLTRAQARRLATALLKFADGAE